MTDKITYITADGLKKLKEELEHLKTVTRMEISERIREAKELGDLSENAEYSDAKDEQTFIENRIAELEAIIRNVQIIKKNKKNGIVQIGSALKLKMENGKEITYTIVGSSEAKPLEGKISNESPLGKAFLGKKEGEIVDVSVPKGIIKYTILEIN